MDGTQGQAQWRAERWDDSMAFVLTELLLGGMD